MKDIFLYTFDRQSITTNTLEMHLQMLTSWISDKGKFSGQLHRVCFAVSGYDLDIRALSQIPEVRQFFKELHKAWPHFLTFAYPHPENFSWWVQIMYGDPINIIDGEVARSYFTVSGITTLYNDWFESANKVVYELSIPLPLYESRQREMIRSLTEYFESGKWTLS